MMNYKKLAIFVICAFLPMIVVGLVLHHIGASSVSDVNPDPKIAIIRFILSAGAMLLPLFAVIITQLVFKEPVLKGLGVSFKINRWWIAGWLLMPVVALAVLGMTLLMPGSKWTPDSEAIQMTLKAMPEGFGIWELIIITIFSGMFAGLTINAAFAFGEEIGWRGFLPKLFEGKPFMTLALWTGVIWGFWHAPLILVGHNYPQHPVAGVFMMIVTCILLTPMLLYFRYKSGSVIVPAIMHGTFNAVVGISALVVSPANDLLYGGPGLAGMITLLLVDVLIFLYDRYVSKENIFVNQNSVL